MQSPDTARISYSGDVPFAAKELPGGVDLFELTNDVVSLHDTDGVVSYVSPACQALLGARPEALAGGGLASYVHAEDRSALDGLFSGMRGAGPRDRGQATLRLRRAEGGWAWVEFSARAATSDDGRQVVVVVWRDVTARQQLENFSRLLQRTAAAANRAENATELLETAAADICRTLGWSDAGCWRVDGDCWTRLGGGVLDEGGDADGTVAAVRERLRLLVHAQATAVCEPLPHPASGTSPLKPAAVVAVPACVGGQVEAVLEFDIADVAEFDAPLAELMVHIGAQLGHVLERQRHLEALERANAELQRSNAELEQFAYVASHDLQEPLRKVASFCSLLQRRYAEQLDADGQEFIAYAVDGAVRMQRLINDLLAYSRVGRGGRAAERVDLGRAVARVLDDLDGVLEEAGAEVEIVGELPAVWACRDEVVTLITNLTANAVKFHKPGVAPHVRIEAGTADGWVRLSVSDDGIGIEPRHQARIFGLFQRLHAASAYPGTGIGLALCRRIAETFGGHIACASAAGQGATFTVTLPAAPQGRP